ncbi:MAG TPA: FHA domain-containing protein [Tepidisphaeraceae bacterium]|nr:FHA domain-containing protein [Tepidisphaeraceae bacterium]
MADSPKSATATNGTTLLPQGSHAGKSAMPLGNHLFTMIGSRNRAHLHLLSSTVSRNHAGIIATKSGMYVRDLASRTGVLVNGRKVREVDLQDGDLIQIGSFQFKVQEPTGTIHLATTPPPPVAMLEMDGHTLTPIDGRTILIGRRPGCDLTLDSPSISNTHAVIFEVDNRRYIRDLGSRTGTIVNGTAVHQQALEVGDLITVGETRLRYLAADAAGHEEALAEALPLTEDPQEASAVAEEEPLEGADAPIPLHFDAEPTEAEPEPVPVDEETTPPAEADEARIPLHFDDEIEPEVATAPAEALPAEQHLTASAGSVAPAQEPEIDFVAPPENRGLTTEPAAVEPLPLEAEPEPIAAEPEPADDEGPAIPFINESIPVEESAPVSQSVEAASAAAPEEIDFVVPAQPAPAHEETEPVAEAHEDFTVAPIEPDAATAAAEPEPIEIETAPPELDSAPHEVEPAPAEVEPAPFAVESVEMEEPGLAAPPEAEPAAEPEIVTAEPEAEAAEAPAEIAPVEPAVAEAPADVPPVEAEAAPAEEAIAPAAEPEPVVLAEVESEPAVIPLLEPQGEAHDETAAAAPLRVEDVDLSAVKFEPEASQDSAAAESAEPAAPAPLLDLAPPPPAEPAIAIGAVVAGAAIAETAADAVEEIAPGRGKRKAKAPKKKAELPGRRSSRKKKEIESFAEPEPATELASADAEASASEVPDIEPVVSESVISEPAPELTASEGIEPQLTVSATPTETSVEATADAASLEEAELAAPEVALRPEIHAEPEHQAEPEPERADLEFVAPELPVADAAPDLGLNFSDAEPVALEPIRIETAEDFTASEAESAQAETIESTEPTPESALDLDPAMGQVRPADPDGPPDTLLTENPLTDTAFGRAVQEMAGSGLGPLVEEPQPVESAPLISDQISLEPAPEDHEEAIESLEAQPFATADESGLNFELPPEPAAESAPGHAFTTDLDLEEPVEIDSSAAAMDLTVTAPEPIEFEPQASEAATASDETATGVQTTSATDEAAAPPSEAPAEPATGSESSGPVDPYFGMQRDMGSFIGGMPLKFAAPAGVAPVFATAPVAPPTLPQTQPAAQPAPVAPAPGASSESAAPAAISAPEPKTAEPAGDEPLQFAEDAHDVPPLDEALFDGEEPLELFDETADRLDALPDSLAPIDDETGALADAAPAAVATAPAAASAPAPAAEAPSVAPAPALRSLTADPVSASPAVAFASAATVTVPPFAGSRTSARAGVNGFAGMSMPKIRATDVFSQTAFPPLDESAFRPQPIDAAPGSPSAKGGNRPGFPAGKSAEEPKKKTPWKPPGVNAAPGIGGTSGRQSPPPPRPPQDERKSRRPWWKNIFLLLLLLVGAGVGVAAAVIQLLGPHTYVQGIIQLRDAEKANALARRDQVTGVRNLLKSPDVQNVLSENLRNQGISAGFTSDLRTLADPENSPFDQNRVVLRQPSANPDADARRMAALLDVLHRVNQTAAERTPEARAETDRVKQQLQALQAQKNASDENAKKVIDLLNAAGFRGGEEVLQDPTQAYEVSATRDTQLRSALAEANANVKQKRDALDAAQTAAIKSGAVTDPKVLELRQKLAGLKAQLQVAQASALPTDPAKAFEDSLQPIDRVLNQFLSVTTDAKLNAYLQQAQQAIATIRQILATRKQDADRVADLRQQIAEHRETVLRQVWSSDETLKQLLEDRDAQAHRYSAAVGSGSTQEATKIQGVIDDLDHRIEARRQSLADGGHYADDVQQNLQQAIDRLDQSRRQSTDQLAHQLTLLDVPAVSSLPLNDVTSVSQLGEQIATAKDAFQRMVAPDQANHADPQGRLRKLTGDVSETQAELDAYQQRLDSGSDVAAARDALHSAQDAEAQAQAVYTKNLSLLSALRDLRDSKANSRDLDDKLAELTAASNRADAEEAKIPKIQPPEPSSVQVVHDPDQRTTYLCVALGLLVLVFAGPVWMTLRDAHAEPPMAMLLTEQGDRPAARGGNFTAMSEVDDDEHAAIA